MAKIWVYGDPAQDSTGFKTTLEILTKARSLGGEVEAVVFGPGATEAAKAFGEHGATKVFAGDDAAFADTIGTVAAAALHQLVQENQPNIILFPMSYDNPAHREMMDLEGLKAWLPGRTMGFGPLSAAVESERFFGSTAA